MQRCHKDPCGHVYFYVKLVESKSFLAILTCDYRSLNAAPRAAAVLLYHLKTSCSGQHISTGHLRVIVSLSNTRYRSSSGPPQKASTVQSTVVCSLSRMPFSTAHDDQREYMVPLPVSLLAVVSSVDMIGPYGDSMIRLSFAPATLCHPWAQHWSSKLQSVQLQGILYVWELLVSRYSRYPVCVCRLACALTCTAARHLPWHPTEAQDTYVCKELTNVDELLCQLSVSGALVCR